MGLDVDPSLGDARDPLFIEPGQLIVGVARFVARCAFGPRSLLLLPLKEIVEIVHPCHVDRSTIGMMRSIGHAFSSGKEAER